MISCSSAFKSKIGGNVRYLKAFLVNASGTVEIKTYVLKTGGMGAERFNFGTVYIPEACIVTTEQLNVVKNEKIQIRLYVNDEKFDSVDGIDNCVVADLYANGSVKSGDLYTVTAYGYLYLNDPVVAWSTTEETVSFSDMIAKIQTLTGKTVTIKGSSLTENQIQSIVSGMKVKRITEQPTVRAYLAQMAESLMGYAYESVAGEFVICHGYPSSDTTGMEANVMMEDVKQNFSISRLTCVLAEGYTGDDGNYIAAKSLSTDGTGNSEVKYRGHTTTEEQFNILKTDIISVQYSPGTLTLFGNPLIEPSDAISFTDGNGETQFIICAGEITQTFNGGLQTEIIAPEATSDADQQALDDEYAAEETERQNKQAYVKTDQLEATNATIQKLYAETAKISDLEVVNATIKKLDAETVKTIHLEAEVAKFGYVAANTVEAQYARLDKANIGTGWIDSAMIGEGVVGTVQIADGSITDAKIVELTANKITAGTLSVERLEIRGTTNSIVYALNNITGALQAQNVDTLNGEILTPRSITADRIVAGAITAKEIASGAITANHILAGAVTANKINVRDLYTIGATIGGFVIDYKSIHSGDPLPIYKVSSIEGMMSSQLQEMTIDEIESDDYTNTIYISKDIVALSYNWFKPDGTFDIGRGSITYDGTSIKFGSAAEDRFTQICKDTITTSYINALKITAGYVDAENITGTTISGKTITGAKISADEFSLEQVIDNYTKAKFLVNSGGMNIGIIDNEYYGGAVNLTNEGCYISGHTIELTSGSGRVNIYSRNGLTVTGQMESYIENGLTVGGPVSATSFVNSSSARYKTNIVDMTDERAMELLKMRPVSYDYTINDCLKDQLGLIAEEVAEIECYPVYFDDRNRPDGLDYSKFVPQLIKLCQIQQRAIDALQHEMRGWP